MPWFEIDFEPGTTTLPFGGVDAIYTRETPRVSVYMCVVYLGLTRVGRHGLTYEFVYIYILICIRREGEHHAALWWRGRNPYTGDAQESSEHIRSGYRNLCPGFGLTRDVQGLLIDIFFDDWVRELIEPRAATIPFVGVGATCARLIARVAYLPTSLPTPPPIYKHT